MNKFDKGVASLIAIIIIVVVALIAGGVAYYYITKVQQKPVADQTAGWKTYTNSEYGFEIKYPDSMSPIVDNYSPKIIWLQQGTVKALIVVDKEPYALFFQGTWAPAKYSEVDLVKVQSSKNIVLNGFSFKKDYWSLQVGLKSIAYSVKSGNQYYSIMSGIDNSKDETVLDNMVSTFKFTK